MTNNRIIIRPAIAQKFQNCMEHHPKPRSRSSRPQSIHGIPSDLNTLQGMAHMKDLPFGLKIFPAQRTQFPPGGCHCKESAEHRQRTDRDS